VFQPPIGAKWFRYDDTCSELFFDFHCVGKKRTLLKELEVDGMTTYKHTDLSHYIPQLYTNLYTFEPHSLDIAEAQRKCWESVPSQVTKDMNAEMTQELTLEEVVEAITSLCKGKAPGHDDLPTKFFKKNMEEIAPTLFLAF
jgi:hypothetical protein